MKLGLALQWDGQRLDIPLAKIQRAEALGFDSVWCAEAYGSDAITPLAFIAAHTEKIRLATGIIQVAARSPTATAMAMATLDQLAGEGRAIAGLGLSGPQIVEGWYGQPWGSPYHKLRDYVQIMKKVWRRKGPVKHEGKEYQLPFDGERALGVGKPLKSILHCNPDIPIWLGTGSETNVILTAEIADGWLPMGFVPGATEQYRPWLERGFTQAGNGKSYQDFHIQAAAQVNLCEAVQAGLDALKPFAAFYVGGMGHKDKNFHKEMMIRRGFPEAAEKIQALFLAGKRDEAAKAVPDEYLDQGALIGPADRIRGKLGEWQGIGVDGLTLHGASDEAMRVIADYVH
ncbi:MAG: LLM class F420-dependent oxidoreductase [Pseudomonadales bacterium]